MPKIRIHTNSTVVSARLRKAKAKKIAALRAAVERTGFAVEREAKQLAPVNDGELRASIGLLKVSSDGSELDVGTRKHYAIPVEQGRGPGTMPNIEQIKRWAEKKLGDRSAGWPVAIKIKREGTDSQPFMEPAAESERANFVARVTKALN